MWAVIVRRVGLYDEGVGALGVAGTGEGKMAGRTHLNSDRQLFSVSITLYYSCFTELFVSYVKIMSQGMLEGCVWAVIVRRVAVYNERVGTGEAYWVWRGVGRFTGCGSE